MSETIASAEQIALFQETFSVAAEAGLSCQANGLIALLKVVTRTGGDGSGNIPTLWEVGLEEENAHVYLEYDGLVYNSGVTWPDGSYPDYELDELRTHGRDVTASIAVDALIGWLSDEEVAETQTYLGGIVSFMIRGGGLTDDEAQTWLYALSWPLHGGE